MQAPNEFDFTMLSNFMRCRRYYYFRHIDNLVLDVPQTAPEFGRCIHAALDVWFMQKDADKAIQTFKNEFVPNPDDDKRTIPVGVKLLELYFEKYKHEGFEVLEGEKYFETLVQSPRPDEESTFTLIGRIDRIIEWDGLIYIMDHKTSSRLGYEFFNKIKPNMQFDGYIIGARSLGYKATGILLDALLVAKGLLVPAQLSKLTPLARDISLRTEEELEEYKMNACMLVEDIQRCYEKDLWYINTESCCDFIECPYRRLCKEDKDLRDRIIKSDYRVEKWSPRKEDNIA